jgi:hypothetical protein
LRATVGLRDLADQLPRRATDLDRVGVHLAEHLRHDAFALLEQRHQQMFRFHQRVAGLLGNLLRGEHGFLGFFGVLVDVHRRLTSDVQGSLRSVPWPRSHETTKQSDPKAVS